jgi:hypothetical protein
MRSFIQKFERKLVPTITDVIQPHISALDPSDLLQLTDWLINKGVNELKKFDSNLDESSGKGQSSGGGGRNRTNDSIDTHNTLRAKMEQIAQDTVYEYLHRVEQQIMEWFGNIERRQAEEGQYGYSADGRLTSSMPQDMYSVISVQLSVASEKLPTAHLKDLVNTCIQALRAVQRSMYDSLVRQV